MQTRRLLVLSQASLFFVQFPGVPVSWPILFLLPFLNSTVNLHIPKRNQISSKYSISIANLRSGLRTHFIYLDCPGDILQWILEEFVIAKVVLVKAGTVNLNRKQWLNEYIHNVSTCFPYNSIISVENCCTLFSSESPYFCVLESWKSPFVMMDELTDLLNGRLEISVLFNMSLAHFGFLTFQCFIAWISIAVFCFPIFRNARCFRGLDYFHILWYTQQVSWLHYVKTKPHISLTGCLNRKSHWTKDLLD